jgi:nitrate reductase NapE component
MLRQFRKFPRIHGKTVPGRRFTANAAYYFAVFVAAPLLAVALVLDFIGWLITVQLLGASCYGVMCLFS